VNLIALTADEVTSDRRVTLGDARAAHLLHVLAVTPGQSVRIGMIDGPLGVGTVIAITTSHVTLQCQFDDRPPPRPRVDLLLALPRPKVLRRLWAQLSAIGVGRIMLTNAGKVERNYFDTHLLTPEVYRPLLIEGLQQARGTHLPPVTLHRRFRPFVEDELDRLCPQPARLVADPAARQRISTVAPRGGDARVLLAVGPEGGWNEFEMTLLVSRGFQAVGMGDRVLRTDTACIALLAVVSEAVTGGPQDPPVTAATATE
jgi:RsmE family RNA methyltransferase